MSTHTTDRTPGGRDVPEVVLSEEQLHVGTTRTAIEVVRISKRIVTETVQVSVQVRHEELVIEHLPVDRPRADSGDGDGREQVFVLSAEVPVIDLQVRPVERVTATVVSVTGEQAVSAEVRRERVEVVTTDAPPGDTRPA